MTKKSIINIGALLFFVWGVLHIWALILINYFTVISIKLNKLYNIIFNLKLYSY